MPLTPEERQRLKHELETLRNQLPDQEAMDVQVNAVVLNQAIQRSGVLPTLQSMPANERGLEVRRVVASVLLPPYHGAIDIEASFRPKVKPRDPETDLELNTLEELRRGMRAVRRIGSPTTQPGDVRRQHFVPRLYLRNFAQQVTKTKFLLHEFNLKTLKPRLTTVEDTGWEAHYYDTHSPEGQAESIDPWLQRVEGVGARVLRQFLATESIDALSDEDRYLLSLFIVTLALRVPAMRRVYRQAHESMLGTLKQLEARLGRADDRAYRQVRPDDSEIARAANDVIVGSALEIANLLFARKWVLWQTDEAYPFITSDNPIVRENPFPDSTFGFISPGLQLALPLSPTLMLLIYDRRDFQVDLHTDRPLTLERDFVRFYNFTQVEQSGRFLLSKDEHCETVFREWQEMTASWPLTWERLIKREPLLEVLRHEMGGLRDDRRTPYVCANELWFGSNNQAGYEERMLQLVGPDAQSDDSVVRGTKAVELSGQVLYETLPYCRNCNCSDGDGTSE